LPLISANFFGDPSKSLKIIGITGTNGKTTTCYLINSILKSAGLKTSMISTFRSYIDEKEVYMNRTTPESLDLQRFFADSLKSGVEYVCMEVSSHSIDLHRVDHIDFDYFVFTNLSQDHLDYHRTIAEYFEVKSRLFNPLYRKLFGGRSAVINLDDNFGKELYGMTDLKKISYSIDDRSADIRASDLSSSTNGISMVLKRKNKKDMEIGSSLCGVFNIYNILAAVSTGLEIGIGEPHIKAGPASMKGFGGRFEKIEYGPGPTVIVDYAHTPDGLENVLQTAKGVMGPGGRLLSVFGCGGDRDMKKRKIMGKISARLADFSIITSDNPRSEKPEDIIAMIEEGAKEEGPGKYMTIVDREEAILHAMDIAYEYDIILVAGKGHEDYQEFENGRRIHLYDPEIVKSWSNENKRKN
ncbi:MAG: UDP-N-acetylmuramoyl-L-alanyl-D-glutamate--2,6-diaminopimelate ligase, partial [Actinobacteria bacterium]|nr:UDP-N-acetylmuramoyl-L-alanyl-D-glutamate--2,6-diaminopimelate ligase [Actinomycetota bacterium]